MSRLTTLHLVLVALGVATILSLVSSPAPDGLERTAEKLGFTTYGTHLPVPLAPFADYVVAGVPQTLATPLAGFMGVCAVCAVLYGAGVLLSRVRRS